MSDQDNDEIELLTDDELGQALIPILQTLAAKALPENSDHITMRLEMGEGMPVTIAVGFGATAAFCLDEASEMVRNVRAHEEARVQRRCDSEEDL